MAHEVIERDGIRFAEIIWAATNVESTTFFSPAEASFQFGLVVHKAGFQEKPHSHKSMLRKINDLQQMLVVQRGLVAAEFYTDEGEKFHEVKLGPGDAILLIHGVHAIRILEDAHCISVKQGPFLGIENDKIEINEG